MTIYIHGQPVSENLKVVKKTRRKKAKDDSEKSLNVLSKIWKRIKNH